MIDENGKRAAQMMKLQFQMARWKTWKRSNREHDGNRCLSTGSRFACLRALTRRVIADTTSLLDHGAPNVSRAENRTGDIFQSPRRTRRELVQKFTQIIASSEAEKVGRLSQCSW